METFPASNWVVCQNGLPLVMVTVVFVVVTLPPEFSMTLALTIMP